MSRLLSVEVVTPNGKLDQCPQLTITGGYDSFCMLGLMDMGKKYAFNAWIKSDEAGEITIHGLTMQTDSSWKRIAGVFNALTTDLTLEFPSEGVYYIYHPQLEIGDIPTDWTPNPDDVDGTLDVMRNDLDQNEADTNQRFALTDELLAKLENTISMLVRDENNESLMTQTADGGWTFSMAQYNDLTSALSESVSALQNQTGSTDASVKILQDAVTKLQESAEYVRIRTYEDEPCIELGEGDSDFKLMITNTRIMFRHGGNMPTYIDTTGLVTHNITINGELRHGNFRWIQRPNGHYSLIR